MKLAEAYSILEIPEGSDEIVAKKAFKNFASKYHPDVNKAPDAESKFKLVNEAYERIKAGEEPEMQQGFGGGSWGGFNINEIFNSMGGFNNPFKKQNKHHHKPDITLKETIFFKETVLGCSREIAFKRDEKCSHCDGEGGKQIDNGCKRCNGKGMTMTQQGNTIYQSVCTECRGRINQQSCDKCNGRGYNSNDTRFTVNIPAGITPEKNVVNIGNQGHFIGRSMVGDQHSRVLIACNITPQDDLRLVDDDVVSNVSISLLEALEGTTKMIPTIDGKRSTIVIAGIKNKDEIVIPNLGMKRRGNQRVIVSVQYPDNVSKLIEAMKDKVGE